MNGPTSVSEPTDDASSSEATSEAVDTTTTTDTSTVTNDTSVTDASTSQPAETTTTTTTTDVAPVTQETTTPVVAPVTTTDAEPVAQTTTSASTPDTTTTAQTTAQTPTEQTVYVATNHAHYHMKGLDLGLIYDAHKDDVIDTNDLERRIAELMMDDDVTKKRGIYYYVFDGDDKHLSIRAFTTQQKREAYERQQGICPACGEHFELDDMEADHITPWSKGGRTTSDNCQMLCKPCNRTKSGK